MENGFFIVDYESMVGVVIILVVYNIFSLFSQEIDDFFFIFVILLGVQYDDVVIYFLKLLFV